MRNDEVLRRLRDLRDDMHNRAANHAGRTVGTELGARSFTYSIDTVEPERNAEALEIAIQALERRS